MPSRRITGESGGATNLFLVETWDGVTGEKAGEGTVEVGALRLVQVNAVLARSGDEAWVTCD